LKALFSSNLHNNQQEDDNDDKPISKTANQGAAGGQQTIYSNANAQPMFINNGQDKAMNKSESLD